MTDPVDFEPNSMPTTTHAEWGAGNPHLIVVNEVNDERFTYPLDTDRVTIGSATDCSLMLSNTHSLHATIVHDDRDEYVVTMHHEGELNANPTAAGTHPDVNSETLRTGAHFTAGPWRFVFQRDEFADHGRPYGGRQGGELSDQAPQPERPDYTHRNDKPGPDLEVQDS